jgi:putative DNA primase/helicase
MSGIPFDTIAAAALSQAESLLAQWFPAGVVEGHEFKIGDIHGTPGESLSVNMRTGLWKDFNGDIKGGDLTLLWQFSRFRRSCLSFAFPI